MEEPRFFRTVGVTWPRWPIYSRNLKESSSLETLVWYCWNLVYSIRHSSTTKFFQMVTLGWSLTFLHKGQLWFPVHLYGKMLKWWITYSETIEVCGINVGKYCKQKEYMEIYMYQRSRSVFDLCPRSLRMKLDLRWVIQDHWSSGLQYVNFFIIPPAFMLRGI